MNSLKVSLSRIISSPRFLVGAIIVLGAAFRLGYLAFIDINLPFKWGGLYVEFAQQIAANHYLLPDRIPFYTEGGVPFAYPPLPFYVEAVLLDIFSLPKFLVANLLPPLLATLALPSFYVLTKELRLSVHTRLIALLVFALMPPAIDFFITAGALARASGLLALIWLATSLVRAHQRPTAGRYGMVGLLWAVCVVASPGTAYASVPTMLIFAVAQLVGGGGSRIRIMSLLGLTGVIALIVSSPYWLTVISKHGIGVLIDSFLERHLHGEGLVVALRELMGRLARFSLGSAYPVVWQSVVFSGAVYALFHHRWFLLVWFVVLFAIPTEGVWMATIPAALLAGLVTSEVFIPLLGDLGRHYLQKRERVFVIGGLLAFTTVYVLLTAALGVASLLYVSSEGRFVSRETITTMEWVKENVPEQARFIVMSRNKGVVEWSPQIMRRTVLNMLYGSEFVVAARRQYYALESILGDCSDLGCVLDGVKKIYGYDDVFLLMDRDQLSTLTVGDDAGEVDFQPLYENETIIVGRLSVLKGK